MTTMQKKTWSLTIGNGGENHTGMEFLGKMRGKGGGWNYEKLMDARNYFVETAGKVVDFYNLSDLCLDGVEIPAQKKPDDAYLMIVRDFLDADEHTAFINELSSYEWDRKYFDVRRQKVLNKHARANVCFGPVAQVADFEDKKGTIISYEKSPLVFDLKKRVEEIMGERDLIVEGNQYDDCTKNGVGAHGDTERVCVACLRVGASMPIKYGMFHNCVLQGKTFQVTINGGDLYFMSEEAVGAEWRHRSKWTWRHAAGADKYLRFKGE